MSSPTRAAVLDQDFEPIITADQFSRWKSQRWPSIQNAIPLVSFLGTFCRSDLRNRARRLAETKLDDGGEDGLLTVLQTTQDALDFCHAQIEILEAVQARLLVVADDLLIEQGQPSELALCDADFDPENWIKRATDAGAAMFVRENELWIGSVVAAGKSEAIERLKEELDNERRAAVRNALASRGLIGGEA